MMLTYCVAVGACTRCKIQYIAHARGSLEWNRTSVSRATVFYTSIHELSYLNIFTFKPERVLEFSD